MRDFTKKVRRHGEGFPAKPLVQAVTNKRLILYSFAQMKGGPKDLIGEYPLSDLGGVSMEKLKPVPRTVLQFADGQVVDLDAGRSTGAPESAESSIN